MTLHNQGFKTLDNDSVPDPNCHNCNSLTYCSIGRKSRAENCPMKVSKEVINEAKNQYLECEGVRQSIQQANIVEAMGSMRWPRLKDTIEYAKAMEYKKLGLAFCVGLRREAKKIGDYLEKYGFKVSSVCCKTGGLKKEDIGLPKDFCSPYSKTGFMIGWVTCNPVAQALLLNKSKTEMNIICGLCVGHDILFTQFSKAPVTTLIAKDRVTIHNPASVLFSHYGDSFFLEDLRKLKLT
ncbi:MAG: DUF1847 domain-containing protein [Candidatus Hermodarchaeota archaeon]